MPKPDSEDPCFVKVKCTDCENEQIIFSHASSEVSCEVCGKTLANPTGGKAFFNADILEIVG